MCSPFIHKEIDEVILNCGRNKNNDFELDYLLWLQNTPKLTTYRVNLIHHTADTVLNLIMKYLEKQKQANNYSSIPQVYKLFSDTIAVKCWPDDSNITKEEESIPSVIVDAFCGAAVLRGSNVFAPAVMGLSPDIVLNQEINVFADISGKCKQGLKINYVDGVKKFVGRGRLKMLRHELFGENLKPRGIAIETLMPVSRVPVIDSNIFPQGSCLLQNLPSIICGKVLDPQPGETVLDMCAAPGNKTTHLAEMMNNEGIIIAIDKTVDKVNTIKRKCQESSITCVHQFAYDSTKAVINDNPNIDAQNESIITNGPPFVVESFDKILLDVPCSALGQRPLLKNNISMKMLKSYIPLQRKLFHSAVKLLKSNGRLVYSTCTITLEECENMVAWALSTFPSLTLVPAEPLCGGPGWADSKLDHKQRLMVQRFGPEKHSLRAVDPIYNDTIGFFIACFVKI